MTFKSQNFEKANHFLMILLGFMMPLTVAGGNIILLLIVFLWILSGNILQKIKEISINPLIKISWIFYLTFLLGLIWTDDIQWGFLMLKKMIDFGVFLPILMSVSKTEHIKYYIAAFLSSIALTVFLSYGIWFELIPEFHNATKLNPTVTMSHISYNPFLAFAAYITLHQVFLGNEKRTIWVVGYFLLFLLIGFNMFITGGRAGQLMFFVTLAIISIQYFGIASKKNIFVIFLIPIIFVSALIFNDNFHKRIFDGLNNFSSFYQENKFDTSVGERLFYFNTSLDIFRNNPLFGVGTGDFPEEFKKERDKRYPMGPLTVNPHNMYLLILSTLGLFGLIPFLMIFFSQLKIANKNKGIYKNLGITLPIFFTFLMIFDSYLLGHFTTMLFIYFSAFLYKNIAKN